MTEVSPEETAPTDAPAVMESEQENPDKKTPGLEPPPWADEPLLPDAADTTTTKDGQVSEAVKDNAETTQDSTKSPTTDATVIAQDQAQGEAQPNVSGELQAVQQFNGPQPMHYPQMTPHGTQPYYHDPMIQAQYHHPHPQSGFMNQIPNPPGTKAKRKRASPHQLALLNQIFEYTFFPSTELRNAIGKELGMAPRTVQIWFQNRRQAWRSTKTLNADGTESPTAKSNDNERGGWEVLRSFQARRANGEIQEYEYMAIPSPSQAGANGENRVVGGYSLVPYHPGMMQVALSSNDQFNSSMQQVPMPLPHTPRPMPQVYAAHPHHPPPLPTTTTGPGSAGEGRGGSQADANGVVADGKPDARAPNGTDEAATTTTTTAEPAKETTIHDKGNDLSSENLDPSLKNTSEALVDASTESTNAAEAAAEAVPST